MKLSKITAILMISGTLTACAQASGDVRPNFVPATNYAGLTCPQLLDKMSEIKDRVYVVSGQQDYKRKVDQSATGVGLVLFWPALIAMPLTADHKRELGDLKGQYEAIGREAELKQCGAASVASATPAPAPAVTTSAVAAAPPATPAQAPAQSGVSAETTPATPAPTNGSPVAAQPKACGMVEQSNGAKKYVPC